MSAYAQSFTAFGIPMERRTTRRKLVVLTYIVLAIVCGVVSWFARSFPAGVSYATYVALGVGMFVFGGQGSRGLVKAFRNKPPRPDPVERLVFAEPVLLALNPLPLPRPDSSWQNDERELARRDAAHYKAYQPLSLLFLVLMYLTSLAVHPPHWLSLETILAVNFIVALSATMLALTLPSAIILWTEPDMDVG